MSTFGGKIQEIPNISVDRFDENNLNSEAYFLSHCHYDHMVGLHTWNFQNNLLSNDKYIYASEITCAILKRQFPALQNNVKLMDIFTPTIVILKNGNVSALPIPAGHCPGSVMFLFEVKNTRVLYTGDYRINKNDIRKIKSFYDSFKHVKKIERIYLDTTFFLKSYLRFPKREESLDELCKIIREWTDRGKKYCIKLSTSARYGYEYMFNEIYRRIGMPVHVTKDAFDFYSRIPEMDNSVTLDGTATQIHCSCGSSYQYICDIGSYGKMRTIKISAFRWTQDNLEDGVSSNSCDYYYVCYSTHASYEEGVELLRLLQPRSVEICVKHDNPETNLQISSLIDEVLDEWRPKEEAEFKHKLFETDENVLEGQSFVVEEASNDFGILDSPPRNNVWKNRRFQKKTSIEQVSCDVDEQLLVSDNNSLKIHSVTVQRAENYDNSLVVQTEVGLLHSESALISDGPPNKKLK